MMLRGNIALSCRGEHRDLRGIKQQKIRSTPPSLYPLYPYRPPCSACRGASARTGGGGVSRSAAVTSRISGPPETEIDPPCRTRTVVTPFIAQSIATSYCRQRPAWCAASQAAAKLSAPSRSRKRYAETRPIPTARLAAPTDPMTDSAWIKARCTAAVHPSRRARTIGTGVKSKSVPVRSCWWCGGRGGCESVMPRLTIKGIV
jgi:hypothetical protein